MTRTLAALLLTVFLAAGAWPAEPPAFPAVQWKALKARSIGPAVMGGRVATIALDPADPYTFYVGLGTGGLMKTSNNGISFEAVFEKEAVAAIGAVAVAPSDPKVVWVGTGEANDRNSSAWGNGVYRSTDAGATWSNVGLKESRTIARIVVHPKDAGTAWVAATGDLWGAGGQRGLYKTTDAGQTWKAVLTAPAPFGDRVGCGEVALDPASPDTLYAVLYARRRTPWSFTSGPEATDGKDVGGIFKSSDGGATWRKLEKGLPGRTARIGLSVYEKDPRIVHAVVQTDEGGTSDIDDIRARKGGVFRSEDAGETWTRTSPLNPRPFYFSQIRIDPSDAQRVYVLGFALHVSEDGGKSFREDRSKSVHSDLHALAVDTRNPKRLVLGSDGGVYQSFDGGKAWEMLARFAAGEYYRINADMSTPYRICGGLQDNTNWLGPSRLRAKDGIRNSDWINIGGGDGFYCVFDPDSPDVMYAESQEGHIHRYDMRGGQVKELRPSPSEGQAAFRFHWNSPLIGSRHAKGTMYLAGNRVFEVTNRGEEWRLISPDLSAQDPKKTVTVGSGAENYGVVYTLAESPRKPGLLWAGTDDGKLWITENGGEAWTDLTASLPALAKGQWISRIEPSAADEKVAYLAVSAFRSQNYAPLAYRTTDSGRTWQSIASNLPPDGSIKVVREDPKNPSLLYAGTEFGLFASLDKGAHWAPFGDLPTVAVDDILVHPRDLDLVVATHGRSLYIVDDVTPMQQLASEVRAKEAHLFPPRPVVGAHLAIGWEDSAGAGEFRGANPPEGALISFWVKEATGEPVKIAIENALGQAMANLTAPGLPGLGRVNWDLKPTKDVLSEYGGEGQRLVRAGEYKVKLTYGKASSEQTLKVEIAPGIETR